MCHGFGVCCGGCGGWLDRCPILCIQYPYAVGKADGERVKAMSRRNSDYRTVWVIEWPDGDRETVQRTRSGWLWSGVVDVDGAAVRGTWGSAWSSHLDSVRDGVADAGGRLVREPNPNYVERTPDPWSTFRRVMSTLNA